MYYDTPNVTHYVRFIKRYRPYILAAYILLGLIALIFFKPVFISSDSLLWLEESK
jgi:predicted membrane channel-forming protein YqfA (hemolysin III family)